MSRVAVSSSTLPTVSNRWLSIHIQPRLPARPMRIPRPLPCGLAPVQAWALASTLSLTGCAVTGKSGTPSPNTPAPPMASATAPATQPQRAATGVAAAVDSAAPNTPTVAQVGYAIQLSDQTQCPSCPPVAGHHGTQVGAHGYAPYPALIPNPQGIDGNEFLCDGGDAPPAARARVGDQIIGVGLEDTVARYTTDRGEVHVTASNQVCLYAPRFGAVRRVTGAELGELAVGPQRVLHRDGPIRIETEQPGLSVTGRDALVLRERTRGPDAMRARDRGVPVENVLQPVHAAESLALLANLAIINRGILVDRDKALIEEAALAATIWSVDTEVVVAIAGQTAATITRDQAAHELVVYELADAGRLRVCKLADKRDALPGEIVTFVLRVDNVGDSPLHDIVLTDNLTTRLEYVPESQTSTRPAEFSALENEGQSLRLTWKFTEELKVGESATVEFKCKVR